MASCAKCGKHPLRKNRQGEFRCRRCGPRRDLIALAAMREEPDPNTARRWRQAQGGC